MAEGLFVTGTDTGIGKSWVSAGLMARLAADGHVVAGMKPIASGCEATADGLRNEDALLLQSQATVAVDYGLVNPYHFEPAIAPHIAAAEAGVTIDAGRIADCYRQIGERAERVVVEGVGGWQVPLGPSLTVEGVARQLGLSVVLVVGMRLGCINHALLTAAAIRAAGLELAGWIANRVDPAMSRPQENIAAIAERIEAPLLGEVPHLDECIPARIADHLRLP